MPVSSWGGHGKVHFVKGGNIYRDGVPVLVGRKAELTKVTSALRDPPGLVMIEGEAGVGKSRLAYESLARVDDRLCVVGRCQPIRDPFPYGPMVQAFGKALASGATPACFPPIVGVLGNLFPEHRHLLPPALPTSGDPGIDRHRIFRAFAELATSFGHMVIALEDLHWIDHSTYELLCYLTPDLPSQLSLLLTFRGDELPDDRPVRCLANRGVGAKLIELRPLSLSEVEQLIGSVRGAEEVPQLLIERIHDQTGGLPYAVEELLRSLPDSSADAKFEVPQRLRDSLMARHVRLDPEARNVVEATAVIGAAVEVQMIDAVTMLAPQGITDALTAALRQGLLLPAGEGRYGFRHYLAEQAMYEAIPEPRRRDLHSRAADAFLSAATVSYEAAAHHCRAAGRVADWRRYTEMAAEQATSVGDGAAAVGLLTTLLNVADLPPSDRYRIALKLGAAAMYGLTHIKAVELLRQMIGKEQLPPAIRGELRLDLGLLLCNQAGQTSEGITEIAVAVAELRERPALAARALSALAVPVSADVPAAQHLRWMTQASRLAEKIEDPATQIAIKVNRATTLLTVGDPAAWQLVRQLPRDSPDPAICHQLARGAMNLAEASLMSGYYRRARRFAERGRILLERTGVQFQASISAAIELRLDWYTGQWEGLAERAAVAAAEWAEIPPLVSEAHLVTGLILKAQGKLAEAERCLATIAADNGPHASLPLAVVATAGQAELMASRGEADGAVPIIDSALNALRHKQIWPWAYELVPAAVEIYLQAGRLDDAKSLAVECAKKLCNKDGLLSIATLAHCRGRLNEAEGQTKLATAAFNDAGRAFHAMGRPYARAHVLEASGRCMLSAGNASGAADVRAALAIYVKLGATWDLGRARALLRSHGIDAAQRRGRRGYGDSLSPREQEIATLAAAGNTNRQIAAALHLSERTVEEHVAKALRKLGIGSRIDLPASLQ